MGNLRPCQVMSGVVVKKTHAYVLQKEGNNQEIAR